MRGYPVDSDLSDDSYGEAGRRWMTRETERVQAHIIIRGRVQGVHFRIRLKEQADAIGVGGWCRNEPDGTVEAVLQGSRASVDAAIRWAHAGPAGASVDSVELLWETPDFAMLSGFAIR